MVTASQRLQNTWKVLAGTDTLLTHPLRGMRRAVQAFYKRFSGLERAQMSDRQGADARRDATSGQFVCFQCPGAGALDQETSGSAPSASTSTRSTHVCRRSQLGAVYHGPSWSETWVSFATTKQRQLPVDPGVIGPAEL